MRMRHVSAPLVLCGCLVWLNVGCATGEGTGSSGGSNGSGGNTSSGGSNGSGGTSSRGGSNGSGGTSSRGGSDGTGGRVNTGGSNGTGGSSAKGGNGSGGSSTGGNSGTGGSTGRGGSGSGGNMASGGSGSGGNTGSGGSSSTSCSFTQSSTPSSKIGTVGIVTWSTTLSSPTAAQIDFGLDTSYGMTAPVDLSTLNGGNYRTLLLGMKASKTYHYKISATGSNGTCSSDDYTIATGALPNGLQKPKITTMNASALYGGFLITGQYTMNAGSTGSPAYILDADGDYVWWYSAANSDATGTRMSYDGKYMWINNANVPDFSSHAHKVTMDGLTDVDLSTPMAHLSHQVTPLPDGSVAFYTTGSNGCDDIKIFPANGTASSSATTLTNARTAHGGTGSCHLNNIEYSPMDDTLVFSDLDNNCLTKIKRSDGSKVWVLNSGGQGITSSFTGDTWGGGEHGIDILGLDDFLIFNNNSKVAAGGGTSIGGDGSGSIALEMKLNLSAMSASKAWSYKANPGIQNDVMGDIERLPNGNTIIAFSTKGIIQEVDSKGTLLQQLQTQSNFGYIEKRATLYGPSTK